MAYIFWLNLEICVVYTYQHISFWFFCIVCFLLLFVLFYSVILIFLTFYLAASDLSCSTRDLLSWCTDSLVVACGLLLLWDAGLVAL